MDSNVRQFHFQPVEGRRDSGRSLSLWLNSLNPADRSVVKSQQGLKVFQHCCVNLCLFTSKDTREAFVCLFVTVKLRDKLMNAAESAPWYHINNSMKLLRSLLGQINASAASPQNLPTGSLKDVR